MSHRFPFFSLGAALIGIAVVAYFLVTKILTKQSLPEPTPIEKPHLATPTPVFASPIPRSSPARTETPQAAQHTPTALPQQPTPVPTPPTLDDSDEHLANKLKDIESGPDLLNLLTDQDVLRKIVRAVYGLSEGRVVRQYRPISSPEQQLVVNKIGKQTEDTKLEIYRISRDNGSRYTHYIALFSKLNNALGMTLYKFYLPALEEAFLELGTNEGSFHNSLITAIDMMIAAPSPSQAIMVTQPSVMYKFLDPELEKLPPVHKLMLRMGQENSEALKLELKKLRKSLNEI